jgi:hypothetical protein
LVVGRRLGVVAPRIILVFRARDEGSGTDWNPANQPGLGGVPARGCDAAVHLKIPDLPSSAARDALEAEDSLIKYAIRTLDVSSVSPSVGARATGHRQCRRARDCPVLAR